MLLNTNEDYRIEQTDCIPHMMEDMPADSVDMSIFSPPFPALYAYTSKPEDIGNSENLTTEAPLHLGFFYSGLVRVMKPGRVVIVHVMQIRRLKRSGMEGTFDFRGLNIRLAQRAGFIYETDIPITKNPQSQAIRTRCRSLQFAGLEADRASSFPAFNDYLIKLRAPGENATPICTGPTETREVSREEWIRWAEGVWTWHDIKQTDVLNVKEGRGKDDTKHICPLQLGVIDRCVRLWSNPGEVVFSAFAGIGSEGYQAILNGRRFYGCEIKAEYHKTAVMNMQRAQQKRQHAQQGLFADEPTPKQAVSDLQPPASGLTKRKATG